MFRFSGLYAALLLLIVFAVGCMPSGRRRAPSPDEMRLPYIRTQLEKTQNALRTLAGRGKITIESPGQAFSGQVNVYLKMPDSLFVKLEALLGVNAGMFFFDHRSVAVFLPMDRVVYIGGAEDTLRLKPLLGFDVTRDEALQLVTGRVTIAGLKEASILRSENSLLLTGRLDVKWYEYAIDNRIGAVTRVVIRDGHDRIMQIQEYRRFLRIAGVTLPQTIRIVRPQAKEALTLFYEDVQVNRPLSAKHFHLKLPSEVIKIRL
ncbi:MAG: DUF4292 domain-containing protein [candidate division KSB1 bacterium]|nr:DUF4292 domain-containing protein [candidate division KSB1 bacterium]